MSKHRIYLAVDLGASSGRVLAGQFDGVHLELEELHRFDNRPVCMADTLYWDLPRLWENVCNGLRVAGRRFGKQVTSIGVDTWGVDYALLDSNDQLLGNPVHYRDSRTIGMLEETLSKVDRQEIFAETGLQFMELNTLYQLAAMRKQQSPQLDLAQSLLLIPDLFHWLMTGEKFNEFTNATTTQFFNLTQRAWSTRLLEKLGIPTTMLGEIAQPGTNLGRLRPSLREETGLSAAAVILPGTHDTASAVMAVPTESTLSRQPNWCYISSGTWSLMGAEVPEPIISDKCLELNFTNEGGVQNTVRLLRNITGLWIVQECRRIWKRDGKDYRWDQLVEMAQQAPSLQSCIHPNDSAFGAPTDMPETIQCFCKRTSQPIPETPGAIIRCSLESLALCYHRVLEWLEQLTSSTIDTVHVVGGGTQNKLLCQMTADACDRQVIAGPIEATAIGNIMMQAVAAKDVASVAEARRVIRKSFPVDIYDPATTTDWQLLRERFKAISS